MRDRYVLGAAAGAACIATSATLVRLADVEPATAAVFRCAYALPVLALLAGLERRRHGPRTPRERLLAAGAGVFFALDLVLWHHTIEAVGAGISTVLANLQVVLVGLAAWAILGERPARRVLVALPVVLSGVVLISGVVGERAYGADPVRGAFLGVATAVSYAGFLLVLREGTRDLRRVASPLFDATAATVLVAAALGPVAGGIDLVPSWPSAGWLVALALTSQVTGWLLIARTLPRLPAALTSVVLLLQPAMALGVAAVVLDERPSPSQLVGCLVVLSGVLLATARRSGDQRRPSPPAPATPSPSATIGS